MIDGRFQFSSKDCNHYEYVMQEKNGTFLVIDIHKLDHNNDDDIANTCVKWDYRSVVRGNDR